MSREPRRERPAPDEAATQHIEVFEGTAGARAAIEEMIGARVDYRHFIGYPNERWEEENTEWARTNIVPQKVAAEIRSTGIYYPTDTIKTVWQAKASEERREASLLPEGESLPLRFYIYGNTVLFIEEKRDDFRTLKITDPRIAQEMNLIFDRFLTGQQSKGRPAEGTAGRQVVICLERHGEAESQAKDAILSAKGRQQAEIGALRLLADIWSRGGGLLKFNHSPVPRAAETFDIEEKLARELISAAPQSPIKIYNPRTVRALEAGGVIGPLLKAGIPYEETVEYWLANPDVIPGKNPKQILEKLKEFLRAQQKLAARLPPGPPIYQAAVTHEIPLAALINQTTGQTLDQLGGGIFNCEIIQIDFNGESGADPIIHFRGQEVALPMA